tara:strand:- start:615 stop:833 length:219 start_codon:yes stop_codon:yes gene_type:complete
MTEKEIDVLMVLNAKLEELRIEKAKLDDEVVKLKIEILEVKKLIAVNAQNYTEAAEYRNQQDDLRGKGRFDA